jgi:molecular chaperone HtpG
VSDGPEKIKFAVEISRMIEVLASQIYPTPFALLRENVQNSFDAILLRKHLGQIFDARIDVIIEPARVSVTDNGIGMTRNDLHNHFWRAGSSSKNTEEARAAGVVGTFGIGAMANFGIAEDLQVETESALTGERTACAASRSTLSVTEDCISIEERSTTGEPGTSVTAIMQADKSINVAEAEKYISLFVSFLPIEVHVNGKKESGKPLEESVRKLTETWTFSDVGYDLGDGLTGDVELAGAINGEVRIVLRNIESGSQKLEGTMVLRQGVGNLQTFRSGFGLATANVSSLYSFGGVADFMFLQPTAGREALTTESLQQLQKIVERVDEFVSLKLSERPESNSSVPFLSWITRTGRYDLCSHLLIRIEPGEQMTLQDVRDLSKDSAFLVYPGTDGKTIEHASTDKPIVMLTRGSPRRNCEINYLRQYCNIEEITDEPKVLAVLSEKEMNGAQKSLAFRFASILSKDYYLEAHIRFGTISHGLPVLVTKRDTPVEVILDMEGPTVKVILELYNNQYTAFGHMANDFARNMIFPRVSDLVPSATRQGAEAFLKSIHRTREIFEYETADLESLTSLWDDYVRGDITFQEAANRSSRVAVKSHQVVDTAASGAVREVVPDIVENQEVTGPVNGAPLGPLPPIQRLDISTSKKVLTIGADEPPLKGYRCFLAVTDRIRQEKGDFFLQPHRTSVVWGGQKALFIFEHHSEDFGLYYDLQTQSLISDQPGGGSFETCTIVMGNRVFIPIPEPIQKSFIPQESGKKRFEVRCDILQIDHRPEE